MARKKKPEVPTDPAKANIADYSVRFTSCEALLTTTDEGRCHYVVDNLRNVVWIDSRLDVELQLSCAKDSLLRIDRDREKKRQAARARRAKKRPTPPPGEQAAPPSDQKDA